MRPWCRRRATRTPHCRKAGGSAGGTSWRAFVELHYGALTLESHGAVGVLRELTGWSAFSLRTGAECLGSSSLHAFPKLCLHASFGWRTRRRHASPVPSPYVTLPNGSWNRRRIESSSHVCQHHPIVATLASASISRGSFHGQKESTRRTMIGTRGISQATDVSTAHVHCFLKTSH